ncbi:copper type II ascorbate-dependent monooxygenase domain protein [Dictyocaulus viviparus]|uniref:Copper type II ascorbate-dependent monooxygenase domain protein n=1 Tax=Dictyocaulus viviparus TaxID=29172 RepID=A0A0D8XCR6_DICVI|nr:copper type II ascorbate-dependent monooxygenase domain protein [Dictyocaulus viviparus]
MKPFSHQLHRSAHLPEQGIYIFGSQLHAHLTGRKIFSSHYRYGVKIGEINRDDHYSPHWQHIVHLNPYIHVVPGDVISTTCIYETLSRDSVTLLIDVREGGYGIEDEMCVNYIYYFPVSEVEVCKSAVDNASLHRHFHNKYDIRQTSLPIYQKYASVNWNEKNTLLLKELFAVAPLNINCLKHDGLPFPNHPLNWTGVPQPRVRMTPFTKQRDRNECPALND